MNSRKRNSFRTLGFQQLEERRLMTASLGAKVPPAYVSKLVVPTVTTSVSSKHVLSITGDTNSDSIKITQTSPNEFTVTGVNGTMINGTHTSENFTGITGDVDVTFKGGAGTTAALDIEGNGQTTFPANLNVNMGNGTNTFTMFNMNVNGSMTLNGGSGHDFAEINYAKIGISSVNQGANDLTISLGGGQNGLVIENFVNVERDLNVLDPSSSGDTMTIAESINAGRYVYIVTGSGNDTVNLAGVIAGSQLNIQTGAGNDNVTLGGLEPDGSIGYVGADSLYVDLGAGNDSLVLGVQHQGGGVAIRHNSTYIGGDGADVFTNNGGQLYNSTFSGF